MRNSILATAVLLAACSPAPPATPTPTPSEPPTASSTPPGASEIKLATPELGERASSPLIVKGEAPRDWFFEAVFPVKLVDHQGNVLAEAPAKAEQDWTNQSLARITFTAELKFDVKTDTQVLLVLEEDMPGQDAQGNDNPPRTMKIPMTLAPGM